MCRIGKGEIQPRGPIGQIWLAEYLTARSWQSHTCAAVNVTLEPVVVVVYCPEAVPSLTVGVPASLVCHWTIISLQRLHACKRKKQDKMSQFRGVKPAHSHTSFLTAYQLPEPSGSFSMWSGPWKALIQHAGGNIIIIIIIGNGVRVRCGRKFVVKGKNIQPHSQVAVSKLMHWLLQVLSYSFVKLWAIKSLPAHSITYSTHPTTHHHLVPLGDKTINTLSELYEIYPGVPVTARCPWRGSLGLAIESTGLAATSVTLLKGLVLETLENSRKVTLLLMLSTWNLNEKRQVLDILTAACNVLWRL